MCLVCRGSYTGGENHGLKICRGQDLYLVCRDSHGSADLSGGHLDGNPRQQLSKITLAGHEPCRAVRLRSWTGSTCSFLREL